jgi:hypothetical protein
MYLSLPICGVYERIVMDKECAVIDCTNTELVYSGIVAFQLGGIPTEKFCYACANAYAQINRAIEMLHETLAL